MHHALLDRRPLRATKGPAFLGPLRLTPGRVHHLRGPARRTLALIIARALEGPVFWLRQSAQDGGLRGRGVAALIDPARLVFVQAEKQIDRLWAMEQVLRAGAVPLAVVELSEPPTLTQMRRLQLACEGSGGGGIGLVLTAEGLAPGAESRWSLTPAHGFVGEGAGQAAGDDAAAAQDGWKLSRERARSEPPRDWWVRREGTGFRLAGGIGAVDER